MVWIYQHYFNGHYLRVLQWYMHACVRARVCLWCYGRFNWPTHKNCMVYTICICVLSHISVNLTYISNTLFSNWLQSYVVTLRKIDMNTYPVCLYLFFVWYLSLKCCAKAWIKTTNSGALLYIYIDFCHIWTTRCHINAQNVNIIHIKTFYSIIKQNTLLMLGTWRS